MDDDEARRRVVDAADALFYARGIRGVGMDAVRSRSGVSLKRIYALFPSKDDLVVAVLRGRSALWNEGVAGAAAAAGTPRERLLAVFDFLERWFCEDDFRGCAFINAFGEVGGTSPVVADLVRSQKADFVEHVAALVDEIGGSRELAAQLALLAEGAQTTAAITGGGETARVARRAAEVLVDTELAATVPA
ncbi:TetR/AcrR family transcriptional regulator [Aeromicrobium sp. IC_218]|uniref:TetR/AcrR family transcriptional regulator n=1 Tax=Aeromicrobium sp. IC_218 TaxID=2545468 RepID=UPI00103D5DCA|nr:TetR/AcrR family transcriptional regulator [Aeromicrobium sp. IC_218]TCI99396.1 TetR/AcrR family transcriptional regulator [Aeromicrobium sp. IC_218]